MQKTTQPDKNHVQNAPGEPSHASPDAEHTHSPAIQVQINTDHNIHASQNMVRDIEDTINASFSRFGKKLTRVEIHLSDDNGSKSHGDDKRCLLEARPAGHQPLVVTAVAATVDEAVSDAIDKMTRLLQGTFEKLNDPKGRTSLSEDLAV
jgi:ribosome-associated translation inhibitor RaiA